MSLHQKGLDFILVSDLDGTLHTKGRGFHQDDIFLLNRIGEHGGLRVIATGRSLYSAQKVLPDDFPMDYLAFSSGAGILCWRTKKLLHHYTMTANEVSDSIAALLDLNLDFMVHSPIPENHRFAYFSTGSHNPDFAERRWLYEEFSRPLHKPYASFGRACQIVSIAYEDSSEHEQLFNSLQTRLKEQKIIRTTSPLDLSSLWLETLPAAVSKANAADWILQHIGRRKMLTLGIGNDFNDLDLLHWANFPVVVEHSPLRLKSLFPVIPPGNMGAIRHAIKLSHESLQFLLL